MATPITCFLLLPLPPPLQMQQPTYLAGILLTLHQLAPENDKLVELQPEFELSTFPSSFTFFGPQRFEPYTKPAVYVPSAACCCSCSSRLT
jgi:hypothetical protein